MIGQDGGDWRIVPAPDGALFEGARWIPDPGVFQWVDILRHSILRWDPRSEDPAEKRELDLEFVTVAMPLDSDRSIVASRSSLHEYTWSTGELRLLAGWTFDPAVRFNDGTLGPDGDVYIGTMSMERGTAEGHLYRWDIGSAELLPVLDGVGISNGIGWTNANSAVYVDSLVPRVDLIRLHRERVVREVWAVLGETDEPDGLVVDRNGTVIVAMWGGFRLERFSATSERLVPVPVPARYPTSVAIGMVDGCEFLLVTAAHDEDVTTPARAFVRRWD